MRIALIAFISAILLAAAVVGGGALLHKPPADADKNIKKGTLQSSLLRLTMPGSLSAAHENITDDCEKCHAALQKTTQKQLCLSCHKDVKNDIEAGHNLHGRNPAAIQKDCKECHTEHKGHINISFPDGGAFQHDMTEFRLEKAHAAATITCESCHPKGKKFRDASSACYSCHKKDDRHDGKLGQVCSNCHTTAAWKQAAFDHSKTKFSLEGRHTKVSCALCHLSENYKEAPTSCAACHAIDDVHDSPKDTQCQNCHTTAEWKQSSRGFDHNKSTKFPLNNAHAKPGCRDCHKNLIFHSDKRASCFDCHQSDDAHQGRYGINCASCHKDVAWKQIFFDHDRDTSFKLTNKHKEAQCGACHKRGGTDPKKLATTCVSCHQADDVHHGGSGSRCNDCHNERGWQDNVKFDHDLTKFPLIGLHATTACGACHKTKNFRETDSSCVSCHKGDDFHRGTLGTDCAKCHNPNDWKRWQFNHNETSYPLNGAHEGLACKACHTTEAVGKALPLPKGCNDCHAKQDVHKNRFGRTEKQCGLCHGEKSFSIIDKKKIDRSHALFTPSVVGSLDNCDTCHEKDDVHEGGFGSNCGQCHVVESFSKLKIER